MEKLHYTYLPLAILSVLAYYQRLVSSILLPFCPISQIASETVFAA